jgi:RHS repeat-associated protein
MAVISDRGELQSAQDFFPFGMAMPGRSTDAKHRYGFNGKETDPETGLNDFGARLYDHRLGRWLSPDPLEAKLPDWSTYTFAFNRVMMYTDPTGMIGEPVNNKPATDGVISTKTTRSVSLLSQVHFMESAPDRPSVYTVRQITTTTTTVLERKDHLYYSTTTTTTESFQQSILFSNNKDHFVAAPYPPETASSTTVTKDRTNGFGTREHLGTTSTTNENAVIQPYRQTLEVLYGVEYKQLLATGITTAQVAAKGSEKIGKNVDKATSGARMVGALVPLEYVPIVNYGVLTALAVARYGQLVEQNAATNSKGLVRSHNLDNVNLTKVLGSNSWGRHSPPISLLK